jgi:hypothetical protein
MLEEELTQEEIQNNINAAFESVNLINNIASGTETSDESIEEKKNNVDRNIRHLEIMNSKSWFTGALQDDQADQIADCILAGNSFIDSN